MKCLNKWSMCNNKRCPNYGDFSSILKKRCDYCRNILIKVEIREIKKGV